YALDVLSVIESTLDDPRQVLSAQQFRARGEAVAAMKNEGIDYETRLELLDDVSHPMPLEGLPAPAYQIYRPGHPWGGDYAGLPQIGRPRHVRAGDDVRRVRALLRPVQVRGTGAPLPGRRLQGAPADRPRRGQDRGAHRSDRMAGRADPPDRLQPDRRVGAAQPPGRGSREEGGAEVAYQQHARVPDYCPERPVPQGHARRAAEVRRTWRARRGGRLDRERLGGSPRRLLRAARRDRHRAGRARPGDADHRR